MEAIEMIGVRWSIQDIAPGGDGQTSLVAGIQVVRTIEVGLTPILKVAVDPASSTLWISMEGTGSRRLERPGAERPPGYPRPRRR